MSSFVIEGGRPLSGEILPQGAKNEALQVICATLLTSRPVTISNVPEISDVKNLIALLAAPHCFFLPKGGRAPPLHSLPNHQ